jgi:hypothetical protein
MLDGKTSWKELRMDSQDAELESITTRLPGGMKQALKIAAARERMSIQEIVTTALSQWLERQTTK